MVRPKLEAASWTIAILWAHFWTASGPALPAPPPQGGAPTPRKSAAAKKDPFLSGKPFTLQELLDLIPDLFERRLLSGVEARGLAFPATPDNLERLRKAGASEGLLRLISRVAPPALPPAPAHARAGPVTVVCSPPECEVTILGVSHGRTQGGMKIIADLPPGKTVGTPTDRSVGRKVTATDPRLPAPGALLVREYKGQSIVVKVRTDGLESGGRIYRSLSAIAHEVTSTKWNGFLFFNLPAGKRKDA